MCGCHSKWTYQIIIFATGYSSLLWDVTAVLLWARAMYLRCSIYGSSGISCNNSQQVCHRMCRFQRASKDSGDQEPLTQHRNWEF